MKMGVLWFHCFTADWGIPRWLSDKVVKNLPANAGSAEDMGSILRLGTSPGVGNGNPS